MTNELKAEILSHLGKAVAELLQAACLAPEGNTKVLLVSLWKAALARFKDFSEPV